MITSIFHWLTRNFALLVIGAALLWSMTVIGLRKSSAVLSDKVTIRISHWQLEPGVREGLNEAAAEYEKLHPSVIIKQEAIPESTYGQWLSTQLMGATAPDIVQIGMLPASQLTAFYARYMTPVSDSVSKPNPYNKGTELEGVPFIRTFKDGMRRSYIPELQEFMNVPLGMASVRIFYNKTLLFKLTSLTEAPADFCGFISACERIAAQKQTNGSAYIPIAGSAYHFNTWMMGMISPLTHNVFYSTDFNQDGIFSKDEMFLGFLSGKLDFSHPSLQAAFRMIRDISRFFPHGWTGLNRDEAIFNFAQQKAVFMSTGLWEAQAIEEQAAGKFEIGVIDFPVPEVSDPDYGQAVAGPRYENVEGGMPLAITNTSPNADIALDFLMFLTSQKQNEAFNRRLKWIPIVHGAKPAPGLEVFEPRMEGVFPALELNLGPETTIKWEQQFTLYQVGLSSYEKMAADFTDFYLSTGKEDFEEFIRNLVRGQVKRMQFAAFQRYKALHQSNSENEALNWIKYRLAVDQIRQNDSSALVKNYYLHHPEELRSKSLFRYSPQALGKIRTNVTGSNH